MSTTGRTLIVLAHPDRAASRVNAALTAAGEAVGVTVRDLHALYPDRRIDVGAEQELLRTHDRVILQFPVHWFAVPYLLKQWLDEVLTYGWAYGPGGDALRGKTLQLVVSTGMKDDEYTPAGRATRALEDLLSPLQATAAFTGMRYAPPLVLHGTRWLSDTELDRHVRRYRDLLTAVPSPVAA
ncbi:NAD(P)H-dependent oxidoreductase [Streptomyces sp. NPDC094143]|uniref:NAD(P)H-dependent oxidoreductase n=1 Tax=Streptomyces sp. NPDC094143 TaxID=3155310 RepID=UPI00332C978A